MLILICWALDLRLAAHFEAYENTTAWFCMFIISSTLAWLKRTTGHWSWIWLSPIALRAAATLQYVRWASIEPAELLLARRDAAAAAAAAAARPKQ